MTDDFWRELLEEPPGGYNHGWKRATSGDWAPLGVVEQRAKEDEVLPQERQEGPTRRSQHPEDTFEHGTFNAYNNQKCRCETCRGFMNLYRKGRRSLRQ